MSITPLGGVGEIGSNMTVFETAEEYLIVDYGILFPYEDFFDINYLIVDFSQLDPAKKTILFFTHGHEDHIGAVIHIINQFPNVEFYAPRFATALIRKKLNERNLSQKITTYREDDIIPFGDFELHPVHVTHSIPDTFGIILKTKNDDLSLLFISDFKYDLNPLYEKPFNIEKVKALFSTAKKRFCFLDSTNILNPDKTISESDLIEDLDFLIGKNKRTFITLFSSNIWRLRTILELSKKHNRYVVPIGRSIRSYLETAQEVGLLTLDDSVFRDINQVTNFNDPKLLLLLTGCQGDHLGALRRVSSGDHKQLKLNEHDQVIFSSKAIPGNEKKIGRICNDISTKGTEIITARDYKIHASGHPGQKDLQELISEINPTHYIPIHGETFFLNKHIDFVKKYTNADPILIGNFTSLHIKDDFTYSTEVLTPLEPKIIHGNALVIEREKISERRKMACTGTIFISVSKKSRSISLTHKGLPNFVNEYEDTFYNILSDLAFIDQKNKKEDDLAEKVRIKARQLYNNILGYKPITMVHVV